MTLTKSDIIESIHNNCGWSRSRSAGLVESCLEIVKSTLESGEDILISGFGKFRINEKHERKGRNPSTGKEQILRARRVITFRFSSGLKNRMNGRQP